jgi:hypothetical protein
MPGDPSLVSGNLALTVDPSQGPSRVPASAKGEGIKSKTILIA